MSRVKRGKVAHKKRKRLLQQVKGFRWGRRSRLRAAKDALRHALTYSYRDRRRKKRDMRNLWDIRINAACRQNGTNYSKFIYGLKKNKIEINRKVLSELIESQPEIFKKILESASR